MPLTSLRKLINVLILIATIGYIARPSVTSIVYDPAAIVLTSTCRLAIDGLTNLPERTRSISISMNDLNSNKSYLKPGNFDPNDYFKVFDHLSITPGYTLDYKYFVGAAPSLYARESSAEPPASTTAIFDNASLPGPIRSEYSWPLLHSAYNYIDRIHLDQSPESYFQLVALALLGDQFYLFWHANYNDLEIVCDPGDVEAIHKNLKPRNFFMWPLVQYNSSLNINPTPVVLIADKTITLRIVVFTQWGGFFEKIYTLDKQNPANVIHIQSNSLIGYDCGISF
jgi:hypothetical protein